LNRAELLATTIDRIEHQTVGRDVYEVLVIDNNSSDHTRRVLAEKAAAYPNLRAFSQIKPGAAATRNTGIKEASGEIVLFIDDDIMAEADLVAAHLDYHRSLSRVSIIGTVMAPWREATDPFLRYLRDKAVLNPYSLASGNPVDFSTYHTGNVSTPAKLLREAGGFNEDFCVYGMEDIELGYRLERNGCLMKFGPAARASHEYFPTYDRFVQRCRQAGYSLGKMIQLHPELGPRFRESAKYPRVLKLLQPFYPLFMTAANPVYTSLVRWESRRGTGAILPTLERHYYWAIRYHFFLGYREYVHHRVNGRQEPAARGVPKLALERHE
jgi:glycosyltransferase involved in cell wall biosynthesis